MNIDYFTIHPFQESHLSFTNNSLTPPKASPEEDDFSSQNPLNPLMDDIEFLLETNPEEEKIFLSCNGEDVGNTKPDTPDFEEIHDMNFSEFLFPTDSTKQRKDMTNVRNQHQIQTTRVDMPFPNMMEQILLGKSGHTKERLLPEFSEMSNAFSGQDSTIIQTSSPNQGQILVDDDEMESHPTQKNAVIGKIHKTPKKEMTTSKSKRKRNTLTIQEKLNKLPYNYVKKALGGILVQEILNDHHNEFLVFCGAGIIVKDFKTWLSQIDYGSVQFCKEVWSHKEWDETRGEKHTFKVALTKITQSFLESNGALKWIQDSCRKENYKTQYQHIEKVILKAINSNQTESLNFQKLFI